MQGQHGPIVGRNEYFQVAEAATSAANHGTVPPRG